MKAANPQTGFAEALRNGDRRRLATFPKADRHCHSIFGASLQSIGLRAGRKLRPPPSRMADLDAMLTYAHSELYAYIRDRSGIEFTAERTIEEAIQDGVTILEMSIDADFVQFYESGTRGFVDFVNGLQDKYGHAIDFRPEIGVSKNRDPSTQIRLAMGCIESGIFRSVDLYGKEHAQQPETYRGLFRNARRQGLKLKAHVGEFGDAFLVERTFRVLDLDEIQHGVAVAPS